MKKFLPYLLILCAACSKSSGDDGDYEAPALSLNNPVNNQVFSGSQDIIIAGTATDNKYIKEIHIVITNLATGMEYLHVHIHPDAKSFDFSQAFTIQQGLAYRIVAIVDDASTHSTAKKVEISCN